MAAGCRQSDGRRPTCCPAGGRRGPTPQMKLHHDHDVVAEGSADRRILTVDQVAELVQLSTKTVMRAICAGELEASQLTQTRGGWRVQHAAIERWMEVRSNRHRSRVAAIRPSDPTALQ